MKDEHTSPMVVRPIPVSMITAPAIAAVLRDLVADGTLSAEQAAHVTQRLTEATEADAVRGAPAGPAPQLGGGGRLAEISGYAGGALLLGAVALFLTSGWQDLPDAARVLILTGMSVLLIAAGWLIARDGGSVRSLGREPDSARRRLVSVLWTFAAASAAGAEGLAVDGHALVAGSAVGLVVAGVCYALVPGAVGQLGVWLACVGLVTGLVAEIGDDPSTTPYAVALVALGGLWTGLAVTRVLREKEPGLALGAGLALLAAQLPVVAGDVNGLGYLLTAAVAVAGFAGYLSTGSWSVLGAGVLATTLVVPEALYDWTDGSVSAAGSLLVAGLTLLAASAIGLRLRREVGSDVRRQRTGSSRG